MESLTADLQAKPCKRTQAKLVCCCLLHEHCTVLHAELVVWHHVQNGSSCEHFAPCARPGWRPSLAAAGLCWQTCPAAALLSASLAGAGPCSNQAEPPRGAATRFRGAAHMPWRHCHRCNESWQTHVGSGNTASLRPTGTRMTGPPVTRTACAAASCIMSADDTCPAAAVPRIPAH